MSTLKKQASNFSLLLVVSSTFLSISNCPLPVGAFWLTDLNLASLPSLPLKVSTEQRHSISNLKQQSKSIDIRNDTSSSSLLPVQDEASHSTAIVGTATLKPPAISSSLSIDALSQQQWTSSANELQQRQLSLSSQCQCNANWIKNQTDYYISKWMHEFRRSQPVTPTQSSQQQSTWQQRHNGNGTNVAGGNNNQHHGRRWIKGTRNEKPNRRSLNASLDSSNTIDKSPESNDTSGPSAKMGSNNRKQGLNGKSNESSSKGIGKLNGIGSSDNLQGKSIVLPQLQGERGPEGPKGERGEKGDRGEPGESGPLISVLDRDQLFDLLGDGGSRGNKVDAAESIVTPTTSATASTPTTTSSSSSGKKASVVAGQPSDERPTNRRQLVFVESEQMLVVSTSLGWRQVQLSSQPLQDFRKAIPKFSLVNSQDRRRLLSTASLGAPNSISSSTTLGSKWQLARGNGKRQENLLPGDMDLDVEDNEGADDEDDDEDEDEDDDDEEEADDLSNSLEDLEDDIYRDNAGDEREDDEEEEDDNLDIRDDAEDGYRKLNSASGNRVVPSGSARRKKPPAGRNQVLGRSAASGMAPVKLDDDTIALPSMPMTTYQVASSSGNTNKQQHPSLDKRMKLRLVALNEPFAGNIHGIRGADFECKRDANRAQIRGSFRAFLASGYQNLNELVRFNVHKFPIVNLRGETLANSWHDLLKSPARMANPLSRVHSFDGRHVATDSRWPNKLVWHGSANKQGLRNNQQQHNCDAWHSDSLNKFGFASPIHQPRGSALTNRKLQRQKKRHLQDKSTNRNSTSTQLVSNEQLPFALDFIEKYPCRMPLILLCIETIGQSIEMGESSFSSQSPSENNSI